MSMRTSSLRPFTFDSSHAFSMQRCASSRFPFASISTEPIVSHAT
jgi:hypothetical protein